MIPYIILAPPFATTTCSGHAKTANYTLDKAPLQVDNLIKQVDNASLQRRF